MASVATARFPAPVAAFQVARSYVLAWALLALNAMALANLAAWWYWAAPPTVAIVGATLFIWLVVALISTRTCLHLPVGRLVWNTQAWSFECSDGGGVTESLGLTADATLDLQFCMLLHFPDAAHSRWVFAMRRHDVTQWLALRRAVYSPAMALPLPTQAHVLGNTPAA